MIKKNVRVNNEFYVCPVFNEAIKDSKTIKIEKVICCYTYDYIDYCCEIINS